MSKTHDPNSIYVPKENTTATNGTTMYYWNGWGCNGEENWLNSYGIFPSTLINIELIFENKEEVKKMENKKCDLCDNLNASNYSRANIPAYHGLCLCEFHKCFARIIDKKEETEKKQKYINKIKELEKKIES